MLKIEIRDTARLCEVCGAGEVVHIPRSNDRLEADVVEALGPEPGRMHPVERRAWGLAKDAIDEAAGKLREASRRL